MNKIFFEEDWYKFWGGRWSLLTCWYWGDQYTRTYREGNYTFLDKVVFTFHEGASSAFTPSHNRNRYGKIVATLVLDNPKLAKQWTNHLKSEVDRIRDFIRVHIAKNITQEIFSEFLRIMHAYYIPHIRDKYVVDFLPSEILKKYLPLFEKARIYAEPVFKETEEFMVSFAQQLKEKTGYETKLLLCLTAPELNDFLKNKTIPSEEELKKRYHRSCLIFDNGQPELLVGDNTIKAEQALFSNSSADTLKGVCAYKGIVRGNVRIVHDPGMAKDFKDGDILIATMTRPDYLHLMKKAAAFVTDSGGILCHAAIVAREMQKPCVTSTQTATKLFKDGDMVEVDATNGIVKKI